MQLYNPLYPIRSKRLYNYITRLPNLKAYYPMWEQDGNVCHNYAPETRGTLNGTITGATVGQSGQIGKAYSFDSDDDQLNFGNILTDSSKISVIFFWYPTENSSENQETIVGYGNNRWFFIYGSTTTKMRFAIKSTSEKSTGNTTFTPSLNTWYMIVGAYDPNGGTNNLVIRIYRDGLQEEKAATHTGTIDATAASLRMGQDSLRNFFIGGRAQHLAIFHDVFLTETQSRKIAQIAGLA